MLVVRRLLDEWAEPLPAVDFYRWGWSPGVRVRGGAPVASTRALARRAAVGIGPALPFPHTHGTCTAQARLVPPLPSPPAAATATFSPFPGGPLSSISFANYRFKEWPTPFNRPIDNLEGTGGIPFAKSLNTSQLRTPSHTPITTQTYFL